MRVIRSGLGHPTTLKRQALKQVMRIMQVHGGNPADGVAYEGATVLDAKQARCWPCVGCNLQGPPHSRACVCFILVHVKPDF